MWPWGLFSQRCRPLGAGLLPAPFGLPVEINKSGAGYDYPTPPRNATDLFHQKHALEMPGCYRHNGCGAETLLCGRTLLLHRDVGRCELSTSCLYLSRWNKNSTFSHGKQACFWQISICRRNDNCGRSGREDGSPCKGYSKNSSVKG